MEDNKKSHNLCSTYMLPLIGLNKYNFGERFFINSYVSEDNKHLIVELSNSLTIEIINQPTYKFQFSKDDHTFAVFEIPTLYSEDIQKFRDGKYSLFSEKAKTRIKNGSGLIHKQAIPGKKTTRTAVELLVLDKDEELREHLERKLSNPGSPVRIDKNAELGSIPGGDNFYELNLSTKLEPQNC